MILAALLLSASLSPDTITKIDAVFAELDSTQTPGCAVAVMREDALVFARGYGMADLEKRVAISPRSVFGLQSTSKQFLAMAIILLIQDGKLAFDDDVRKYVPELPDYGAKITIRHLLDHTSGLRDINILLQDQGMPHEEFLSRAHGLRLITRQRSLNHPPGAAASYTNSGYYLLPAIIERVTGETSAAFLQRRIFEPLGMSQSSFRTDASFIVPDRVSAYRREHDDTWRIAGAGRNSVFTSVLDLVKWNLNFTQPKVGGEEAIRWMTTWAKLATGETTEWGLGLSPLRYKGLEGYYFSGGGGDGTSVFARFPNEKFAMAMTCNIRQAFNAEELSQKVIDIVLADAIAAVKPPETSPIVDPQPIAITAHELQRFAGLYFSTQSGPWTRNFRVKDGALHLVHSAERSTKLIPIADSRFRTSGARVEYQFTGERVKRISSTEPVYEFTRVDETKPANLAEFTGTFYNDEVEATLTFSVVDGKLAYAFPRHETPDRLEPMFRDAFADGPLYFRFRRDARGRVTGVTKHWDRAWSLEYAKR